jgi:photosystem II stability/assembly factor-like uncharacterized protein
MCFSYPESGSASCETWIALTLLGFFFSANIASAQWQIQNSNTTADLRGIDNVGGGVAWASGTNGTVLRTEDGGYAWQTCAMPPGAQKLDFRGIQAFDANTAIVMSSGKGDLSRLYKTTDGCQTWKLVFTNPDKEGFWDGVYFDRGKWGFLLGDPVKAKFALFASDDSGKTWIRQINVGLSADPKTQGAFAASNSSLIGQYVAARFGTGGSEGAFYYMQKSVRTCLDCSSADLKRYRSGRDDTWARSVVPVGGHSESSGIFSLAMNRYLLNLDLSHGVMVAVGGDYVKPDDSSNTAAYTFDSGETWVAASSPPHGFRSAVAYDVASKTWITVGPNGTDISTDDGKNWRALKPDPARHEVPDADRNWNALSLPFVVGPKGRIGKLNPTALAR